MKLAMEGFLFLSIAAGLAYFFLPHIKQWVTVVFLTSLTLFVAMALSVAPPHSGFKEATNPALDLDQAELSLRVLTAFKAAEEKESSKGKRSSISSIQYQGTSMSQVFLSTMYTQIVSSLERRLEGEPKQSKDFLDLADIAIVCGHSDDGTLRPKFDQAIRQLLSSDSPRWKNLGQVISTIYAKDSISKDQFNNFKHTLEGNLPVGWYRTQACMRLLLISGQTAAYNHVKEENYTNMLAFSQRVITLLMIMSTAALTGIITILVFFATETRKGNTPPYSTVPWSFTTTYGVTVGWLATQLVMQLVVLGSAKQGLKHILHAGSAATAILTVVIYVITTGPALLYIWWFACRPFNLRFLDAIGLHLSNASANFFKLTVRGVLTWCAAIPVVLGSQLLAMKLFSSQGSSNPVLTLVRDVAHSPSIVPVIIYFIILGILAPFVEETLFRGFLYSSLRTKLGRYLSAAISAALFAIAHFDPGASISLFALGFLFALVRERYQSILPSIVGHGMWNCGTFLLVLVLFGN